LSGLDVRVTGVPAYSTLGWFNDPVLSTFIHYPDAELARLIFHELAHQVAYVPGDSQFNESFATAVEEAGVSRWLEAKGDDQIRASYLSFQQRREDFLKLLETYRARLDETYRSPLTDTQKRARKAWLMAELQTDYTQLKQRWGGYTGYDRWFNEPTSNAHFALISTYYNDVPAFRQLLAEKNSLPVFYQAVRTMTRMDPPERRALLLQYKPFVESTGAKFSKTAVALQ
jgi:predicted aminopeptidase